MVTHGAVVDGDINYGERPERGLIQVTGGVSECGKV